MNTWVCTNAACPERDIAKSIDVPAETEVYCGACQQRCEYREPA